MYILLGLDLCQDLLIFVIDDGESLDFGLDTKSNFTLDSEFVMRLFSVFWQTKLFSK